MTSRSANGSAQPYSDEDMLDTLQRSAFRRFLMMRWRVRRALNGLTAINRILARHHHVLERDETKSRQVRQAVFPAAARRARVPTRPAIRRSTRRCAEPGGS